MKYKYSIEIFIRDSDNTMPAFNLCIKANYKKMTYWKPRYSIESYIYNLNPYYTITVI